MTLTALILGWVVLSIPTALLVAAVIGSAAKRPVGEPAHEEHKLPKAA